MEKRVVIHNILPLDLRAIRGEVMDTLPPSSTFSFAETAGSLKQEGELKKRLTSKTSLSKKVVEEVIKFIKKCHGDQYRPSGEPYYTHAMAVAKIVLVETQDPATLLAALLHDVVEQSKVPLAYVKARFGPDVAHIVHKVTHMGTTFHKKLLSQKEAEELLSTCQQERDIRPVQVKIAEIFHNISTVNDLPLQERIERVRQALTFYIPFANLLGVKKLTAVLQKKCVELLDNGSTRD